MMTPEQIAAMRADMQLLQFALITVAETAKIEIDRLTKALDMIATMHPETLGIGARAFAKTILKPKVSDDL